VEVTKFGCHDAYYAHKALDIDKTMAGDLVLTGRMELAHLIFGFK
jgi:hypothetical protein